MNERQNKTRCMANIVSVLLNFSSNLFLFSQAVWNYGFSNHFKKHLEIGLAPCIYYWDNLMWYCQAPKHIWKSLLNEVYSVFRRRGKKVIFQKFRDNLVYLYLVTIGSIEFARGEVFILLREDEKMRRLDALYNHNSGEHCGDFLFRNMSYKYIWNIVQTILFK